MGMDLNLYLGLHRSPRSSNLAALGFDLALRSRPLPSSSIAEGRSAPPTMSGAADSHAPYSPSHASYNPDLPSIDPLHPFVENPSREYEPYSPPHALASPEHEGPGSPYSPSVVQGFPLLQETDDLSFQEIDLEQAERAAPGGDAVPYSPPYAPMSPTPLLGLNEVGLSVFQSAPIQTGEYFAQDDGSYSLQDFVGFPEFCVRRRRHRRVRSSLPYDSERFNLGRPSSPVSEQLLHDGISSQRGLEMDGDQNMPAKRIVGEVSDEETEDKSRNSANFECNICLDMAKEPIVTSCGHLFCWPCLYQWLHLHLDHAECPVCKGEVTKSNLTPIYGRGSSGSHDEKKIEENGELGLKIPPRPRGNRYQSFRNQFEAWPYVRREPAHIVWQHPVVEGIHDRYRFEGDLSLLGSYHDWDRTPLTRVRARRMPREERIAESRATGGAIGLPRDSTSIPQVSNSSLHGLPSSGRLAAITTESVRLVGRFASSSNQYAASTSSVNPSTPEQLLSRPPAPATLAADRASASSTMAVIQGDAAVTDVSAEPGSSGSTRRRRRRGRSNISISLDADGGALHARKRRMN